MPQITCKDLVLGYEGAVVTSGISFEVHRGDYLCIVGENGAGKSTLVKALLKLILPMEGEILFGEGLNEQGIGYLPQQTEVQRDFPASVAEVVGSGCLAHRGIRPFISKADKALIEKNLERMGIAALQKRSYRTLSGGQQQRVLLARALCATRQMLLLDEPTSGLDPKVTQDLYQLLRGLNREGISIIMVSHDTQTAVREADHILHVGHTPLFFGKKEDYLLSPVGQSFLSKEKESL